ncbi:hypothetical protein UB44_23315 [Burkholderiaceae bacterium 26]|nr:hypothetical protein UB44_23315 [Burkholderiaceae bacterium 26]
MKQVSSVGTTNAGQLKWIGDDLCADRGRPALIHLIDESGKNLYLGLADVLARAGAVDTYGLGRVTSCARFAAEHGYLHPADAEAWRQWSNARQ